MVQTGITLTVGQAATLNITLKVGDVKEVVTVSADAELINTTTAEIGTTVGEEAVKELPLNGRNPSTLVLLSSGVTNVLNTGGGTIQGETTMPAGWLVKKGARLVTVTTAGTRVTEP